ncbi:MAG: uroporphyrinogen decarboxylase family protein [Anaerolineales bacterium]|jgi:uroporphyrinogen-III decarboxylase
MLNRVSNVERTRVAFSMAGTPDRVPVHSYLGLDLLIQLLPKVDTRRDLFQSIINDPKDTIVRAQRNLGLDPIVTTYGQHLGEAEVWPNMLLPREIEHDNWVEKIITKKRGALYREVEHQISTPKGNLFYSYRIERNGSIPLNNMLGGAEPEKKLDLLRYRPSDCSEDLEPLKTMIGKIRDKAWWMHYVIGPWGLAVEVRGAEALIMDTWDRPQFVHDLMRWCTDWIQKHIIQITSLYPPSICINESWVGLGLSPRIYREFIYPYDKECVSIAQVAKSLVCYHNCGKGSNFLEDMVATGTDGLETITPASSSGDFNLADVKHRVGKKCCIMGGFDERVFSTKDINTIEEEVRRCIDAAAEGGGYILRPAGQIINARPMDIEAMCTFAHKYGSYH